MEDKDRDDVMERLLELGGDKKYLTFDDLNRELPDNVVSPDDIEDVLQKLEGSNIPVADSDERLLEQAATTVSEDEEEVLDEDIELDLSAGALEKTNDPVRLYLREMGVVMLTSSDDMRDVNKAYQLGADSFLVKPLDFERFAEISQALAGCWAWMDKTPEPHCAAQSKPMSTISIS